MTEYAKIELLTVIMMLFVFILIPTLTSYFHNKIFLNKSKYLNIDYQSYWWGFFRAHSYFAMFLILIYASILSLKTYNNLESLFLVIGSFLSFLIFWGIYKRTKWGWVLAILTNILTLNIVVLIIDIFYVKKRWKEISNEEETSLKDSEDYQENFYETALVEFEQGNFNKPCYAMAISEAFGDDNKIMGLYIKYRVDQLKKDIKA